MSTMIIPATASQTASGQPPRPLEQTLGTAGSRAARDPAVPRVCSSGLGGWPLAVWLAVAGMIIVDMLRVLTLADLIADASGGCLVLQEIGRASCRERG